MRELRAFLVCGLFVMILAHLTHDLAARTAATAEQAAAQYDN
jgi:hypothetical protein